MCVVEIGAKAVCDKVVKLPHGPGTNLSDGESDCEDAEDPEDLEMLTQGPAEAKPRERLPGIERDTRRLARLRCTMARLK